MTKPYTYTNRYRDVFTFTPTEDGNILWEGEFEYYRCSPLDDSKMDMEGPLYMVDPSGGPFICQGMKSTMVHPEIKGKVVKELKMNTNPTSVLVILEEDNGSNS